MSSIAPRGIDTGHQFPKTVPCLFCSDPVSLGDDPDKEEDELYKLIRELSAELSFDLSLLPFPCTQNQFPVCLDCQEHLEGGRSGFLKLRSEVIHDELAIRTCNGKNLTDDICATNGDKRFLPLRNWMFTASLDEISAPRGAGLLGRNPAMEVSFGCHQASVNSDIFEAGGDDGIYGGIYPDGFALMKLPGHDYYSLVKLDEQKGGHESALETDNEDPVNVDKNSSQPDQPGESGTVEVDDSKTFPDGELLGDPASIPTGASAVPVVLYGTKIWIYESLMKTKKAGVEVEEMVKTHYQCGNCCHAVPILAFPDCDAALAKMKAHVQKKHKGKTAKPTSSQKPQICPICKETMVGVRAFNAHQFGHVDRKAVFKKPDGKQSVMQNFICILCRGTVKGSLTKFKIHQISHLNDSERRKMKKTTKKTTMKSGEVKKYVDKKVLANKKIKGASGKKVNTQGRYWCTLCRQTCDMFGNMKQHIRKHLKKEEITAGEVAETLTGIKSAGEETPDQQNE